MSGTKYDKYLRLVPLVQVMPDSGQQKRFLALAAEGKIRLYVHVHPGQWVYASASRPFAGAHGGVYDNMAPGVQRQLDRARREGRPFITNPTPHRGIVFLALSQKDTQSLLAARQVLAHWFHGGLRLPSDEAVSQQGWLEPVQAMMCMRPIDAELERGPWLQEVGKYTAKIEVRDVMLDDSVPRLAADPNCDLSSRAIVKAISASSSSQAGHGLTASELHSVIFDDVPIEDNPLPPADTGVVEADPYELRDRIPGVFHLFAASRHFFPGPNKKATCDKVQVKKWLQGGDLKDCKKLYNDGNAELAFKLINPNYTVTQGASDLWEAKPLDPHVVACAYQKYQKHCFISERLAVVIHAADWWQDLLAKESPQKSKIPEEVMLELIKKLRNELKKWRFSAIGERKTISEIVIWPVREVDLKKSIRHPKSR
jgi:hypothetical protein